MRDRQEKDLNALTSKTQGKDPVFGQLVDLCSRYAVLDAKIQGVLSPRLQGNIEVAQIKDRTLIMAARSSAWVSRAQLEAETIRQTAQSFWDAPIDQIKVVVGPNRA